MRATVLFVAAAVLAACALLSLFIASMDPSIEPAVLRLSEGVATAGWVLVALLVLLTACAAAVVEWRRRRGVRAEWRERRVALWPLFLLSAVALVATFGLTALAISLFRPPSELRAADAATEEEREAEEEEPPEERLRAPPSFGIEAKALAPFGLAAAVAATVALLAVLAVRMARARGEEAEADAPGALRRELATGLRVSLEAILAEEDLRRAVIACYARMEQSFGAAGFCRGTAETPFEYLDRVMRESHAATADHQGDLSRALGALTRLYEIARFSEHPVRPQERVEALEALGTLETVLESGGARVAEALG